MVFYKTLSFRAQVSCFANPLKISKKKAADTGLGSFRIESTGRIIRKQKREKGLDGLFGSLVRDAAIEDVVNSLRRHQPQKAALQLLAFAADKRICRGHDDLQAGFSSLSFDEKRHFLKVLWDKAPGLDLEVWVGFRYFSPQLIAHFPEMVPIMAGHFRRISNELHRNEQGIAELCRAVQTNYPMHWPMMAQNMEYLGATQIFFVSPALLRGVVSELDAGRAKHLGKSFQNLAAKTSENVLSRTSHPSVYTPWSGGAFLDGVELSQFSRSEPVSEGCRALLHRMKAVLFSPEGVDSALARVEDLITQQLEKDGLKELTLALKQAGAQYAFLPKIPWDFLARSTDKRPIFAFPVPPEPSLQERKLQEGLLLQVVQVFQTIFARFGIKTGVASGFLEAGELEEFISEGGVYRENGAVLLSDSHGVFSHYAQILTFFTDLIFQKLSENEGASFKDCLKALVTLEKTKGKKLWQLLLDAFPVMDSEKPLPPLTSPILTNALIMERHEQYPLLSGIFMLSFTESLYQAQRWLREEDRVFSCEELVKAFLIAGEDMHHLKEPTRFLRTPEPSPSMVFPREAGFFIDDINGARKA